MLKATLLTAVIATAGVSAAVVTPVGAEETPSLDISGTWKGKGFVQKNEKSGKMNVTCQIEGQEQGDEIGFDGVCRAMMVLKRAIGADILRSGQSYTGTYVGSDAGPAALHGDSQSNGRVVLTMTFPKIVNGDDVATMTIEPSTASMFKITTVDMMDDGETEVTTSQITFQRD